MGLTVEKRILRGSGEVERFRANIAGFDCVDVKVNTTLDVSGSQRLTTLKGCPKMVGELKADDCGLESLDCEYASIVVLNVNGNPLTSLAGVPWRALIVRAAACDLVSLDCENSLLQTLNIRANPQLATLKGCPKEVENLDATQCPLKRFECRYAKIGVLAIDSKVMDMLGCPHIKHLQWHGVPDAALLWASGRVKHLSLPGNSGDVPTLFRFKHQLTTGGFRAQARLT